MSERSDRRFGSFDGDRRAHLVGLAGIVFDDQGDVVGSSVNIRVGERGVSSRLIDLAVAGEIPTILRDLLIG